MYTVIKSAIIFFSITVLVAFLPLSAKDQDNNTGARTQEKNESNPLDEEIKKLHERVNQALKAYSEGQNKQEDEKEKKVFPLDMGMTNRMGDPQRNVYEEKITLGMSGDSVSRIELFYTQTNAKSLSTETRTIINENPSGDIGDIKIVYETAGGVKDYKVKSILKEEKRNQIKRMYRNYLTRLLKRIEYQVQRRKAAEGYEIDKILDLGSANN